MRPDILLYGFLFFLFCFLVHIVIWRIKTPWGSSLILLVIFLGMPAMLAQFLLIDIGGIRSALSLKPVEIVEIVLLHFSLSSVYIASYPAARAVSPSLDILMMISESPGQKMTEEEMKARFSDLRLVTARIDDLKEYRFIKEHDGRFTLLPLAVLVVSIFVVYRKLLGLPMGEG